MSLPQTVLVVDDDAFMRTILERVLSEAGLAVETFDSAQGLLDNADLETPAVLLLDVFMPGISGLELQAMLRQRGVALPIVFLTGSSDIPMAVEAMRNGALDFLEKPFDNAVLVERIRRGLQASASASAAAATAAVPRRANADYAARFATLTGREREVCGLMVTGKTSKLIARELGGSFRTIEIHRSRVLSKMEATSLADLVRMTFEIESATLPGTGGPGTAT